MPLRVEISHERRFVHVVARGRVTLKEMEAHFDQLVVENALGYAKLFDATNLEPVYSEQDVLTMGARLSAYTANFDSGPLAVVGREEQVVGAFRRFVNISPSKRPARIFSTEAKALAWLRLQAGGQTAV
jgi:hypothetical protein